MLGVISEKFGFPITTSAQRSPTVPLGGDIIVTGLKLVEDMSAAFFLNSHRWVMAKMVTGIKRVMRKEEMKVLLGVPVVRSWNFLSRDIWF